ncbi:hypothetical protein SAMN06265171_11450 [Chryseobacterium rhizoplanae]|uniref:Uncharacterized protein n=1 Tax=Chryseobacterium rhizoplanae TaxID=1609531 RepID=A0A521FEW5_9FLAO|nr:hypothetical protein [Chryseobacterium rhizoplanae]SMO94723.1 hypothetical protein SAMN06265171_11450 [Chryseobacterium rhizoplanae]
MNTESNNPLQPGTMSNSLIQALIDNYRQTHLNVINTALGIDDAHSIWFDLPKLKNFIANIEAEATKANPDASTEDLGVRFYYATYPKQENWSIMDSHPVPIEYAGRHTLVMVPTLKKTNETGELIDYDFNPFQSTEGKSFALANKSAKGMGEDDDTSLGENNGILVPPKAPLGQSF